MGLHRSLDGVGGGSRAAVGASLWLLSGAGRIAATPRQLQGDREDGGP